MADRKKLEIKIGLKIGKMPLEEYEAIMKLWKRYSLKFEKDLRHLADDGIISFKILDEFTKKFKFDELHRLRFTTPEEPEMTAQRPGIAPSLVSPTTPQYLGGQPQQPMTQPAYSQPQQFTQPSSYEQTPATQPRLDQSEPRTTFPSMTPTPSSGTDSRLPPFTSRSATQPAPQSGFQTPSSGFNIPEPATSGFRSFSEMKEPGTSRMSTPPQPEPSSSPNFGFNVPGLSSQPATPSSDSGVNLGVDEEDRATGIAILRKKMLTELRKIRSVVEQEGSDDTF